VIGVALLALAALYMLISLILWPFGAAPGGWAHVAMALVALFGLQFVTMGILGEYVGRIFEEAKGRPIYIVRETVGFPAPAAPPEEQPEAAKTAAVETASGGISVYT
jgi:hypothetical protein